MHILANSGRQFCVIDISKQTHPTKKKFRLPLIGKIQRKGKQRRKVTERKKIKKNMF